MIDYPDQRVVQTRKKLRDALIQFLYVESIEKIKVSKLTQLAGINRTTFYYHYGSIDHLFEHITNDVIDDVITSYRYPYKDKSMFRVQELDAKNIKVFSCIKDYKEFFSCVIGSSSSSYLGEKLTQAMIQVAKEDYRLHGNYIDQELHAIFHAHAIYGLILYWVEMDFAESEQYMVNQLITILNQSSTNLYIRKNS